MGWAEGVATVRRAVADGVVPGAVLLAGTGAGDEGRSWAGGHLGQGAGWMADRAVAVDTVFDLASLTKVLGTLPAVLRLTDAGDIGLDDAVVKFLPGFAGAGKDAVTVRQLLTHSSGLPAHRELYRLPGTPRDLFAAALAEPLAAAPGTTVCYSDLGFIALGELVAAVTGQSLERAVTELVCQPAGLRDLRYRPPAEWRDRTAATEIPPGADTPKLGEVHDENAAALGGVAGHAGLFGTAPDVARALRTLWLAEESPLSAAVRAEAFRCHTEGLDGRRGLGWTLRGDRWDHMSVAWPRGGAGHTGFTGTCVALDPDSGMWAVLLTNAVRFGREKGGIVALRRRVHDALAGPAAEADPGPSAAT
jgi:CubicO group peptidase (beta-lactamase class C family)